MCISAPVSFAVSAALAVVGAATIRKALAHDRPMLFFALFPAIFSIHQFSEGMVWLSMSGIVDGKPYSYAYIFVAVLVGPFLTPLAAALAESDLRVRRRRYVLFSVALVVVGYLVFKLANASGLDVTVVEQSLSYVINYDAPPPANAGYAYAVATVVPLLTLRSPAIRLIGALIGATFLYAIAEKREVWFSARCFSAAIFSALILFAIRGPVDAG